MLQDQKVGNTRYTSEVAAVVVESLTLLGQIACKGGDWLQKYSYVLSEPSLQQCLASAILQGDNQLRQATLALVGTLGFSTDRFELLHTCFDFIPSNVDV